MDEKNLGDLNNDYLNEKNHLDDVISKINKELNNYLERRKDISSTIVEYRKNFIEEYRDDDDRVIEYFDHENHKNEQIFNVIEKKIKELLYLKESPYFGKISIVDESEEEDFYIGSYGFDIDNELPLVIDWRAPIASLFYQGRLGKMSYKVQGVQEFFVDLVRRRQFLIKNSKIVSMFDSDIDIRDDFLKEMLSLKASNKLKNIVKTIQATQDEIIRQDRNKAIIINGVAGSGKTSIALHRVAYLLYNFREYFKDRVLILGPNKVFMEYISTVLPSLGEYGGIYSATSENFIYSLIDKELNVISFSYHMEKSLSDKEYLEEFKFKSSKQMEDKLDEFLNYVENNVSFGMDIYFRDELIITYDEMHKFFYESFKSRKLEVRINLLKRRIIDKINKVRNKLIYEVSNRYDSLDDNEGDLINHHDMLKKNEIYDIVSEASLLKDSLRHLNLGTPFELYREFYEEYFYKDLKTLDFSDLVSILYLKLKAFDFKRDRDFKLVIIDEAQDFSYMFYNVIKEYTKASSYIIVGDINQKIIDFEEDYLKTSSIFENRQEYLLKDSYRSTNQIIEYSKKYLSFEVDINGIREGDNVEFIEIKYLDLKKYIADKIRYYNSNEFYNICIIVKNKNILDKVYSIIKDTGYIKVIENEDHIYNSKGVFLTTVYFSKGLEFDCVIMLEDTEIEDNLMYIMSTRAMHNFLHVKIIV